MDSAADISVIERGFSILFHSGETTQIGMAAASAQKVTYDIVTAVAVVIDSSTSKNIIIIINQAVYIPGLEQRESLLHTDQARNHCVYVNDLAKCFHDRDGRPGLQSIEVDRCIIPLKHDGSKYFLHVRGPMDADWKLCQIVELTSPKPWSVEGAARRVK